MTSKRNKKTTHRKPAATADVLGMARPKERVPLKWKKHHDRLVELRNRLLGRKGELIKDANDEVPTFSLHMADAGTDSYDRDLALSRVSSEQIVLYEIEEAINRIRSGAYGICEVTGKAIEARRLEAIPWARYCAAAEKELEKNGALRSIRLAPRETMSEASVETDESGNTLEDRLEQE